MAETLTSGRSTHDYATTAEMGSARSLLVATGMLPKIPELLLLYRQPVQSVPNVKYLPYPYPPKSKDRMVEPTPGLIDAYQCVMRAIADN